MNFNNGQFADEIIISDWAVSHTRTARHAAPLQQEGRHQVRCEPAVDGSEGPPHRVEILRVRVCAGLGRQQVRGDAESTGREEDVQNMIGYEQFGIALRTEVKKVNISKSFHM